jgi:hypothetical protein
MAMQHTSCLYDHLYIRMKTRTHTCIGLHSHYVHAFMSTYDSRTHTYAYVHILECVRQFVCVCVCVCVCVRERERGGYSDSEVIKWKVETTAHFNYCIFLNSSYQQNQIGYHQLSQLKEWTRWCDWNTRSYFCGNCLQKFVNTKMWRPRDWYVYF